MKNAGRRAVRWAVFGACFFATIEVACRIEQAIIYGAPILGVYTYDSALFTVDKFGVVGKPNGHYEKWQLNSVGFRGPEFALEKKPAKLRIACVGASETFGLYETTGEEWPRQLERLLVQKGIDAEVINGAIPGTNLIQRSRNLQRLLLRLKPDVVLFMLEYGSHAGLTPEKVRALRDNAIVLPEHKGVIEGLKLLRSTSRLRDVVLPKLPALVREIIGDIEGAFKLQIRKGDVGPKYRLYTQVQPFEVQVFTDRLEEISVMSSTAGVRLVILLPALWFTEQNFSNIYLSWPYVDESWWRGAKDTFSEVAKQFAIRQGIDLIDLSDAVAVRGREEILMKDMLHFSDDGAKQVADRIAHDVFQRSSMDLDITK